MPADKALQTIARALSEALDSRRRAGIIEEHYYKELARISLASCPDPAAAFIPFSDGGDAASALLASAGGLCRPGVPGALFAKYCSALLDARGALPPIGDMFPSSGDENITTVAYVTGSAADAPFLSFADEFSARRHVRLRPHHAKHIAAACDCVLDGEADLAIVPIWNSRDGRLRSFYRMIDGYDLKILSVVETAADDIRTVYALCGSDLHPLYKSPAAMEFSVRGQTGLISTLTDGVAVHGHAVSEITSYPTEKGQTVFHFIISVGGDLRPTVLYLGLFHPGHTVLGIYGNRDSNA